MRFTRHLLGIDTWQRQDEILRALDRPKARVAVKSCHASGKTLIAAAALLWFLVRYPDAKVVTTAPTWYQVKALLWGEVHRALSTAKFQLPVEANLTEISLSPMRYAIGLSTNEGLRFHGFHGRVLFISDEAPGVRQAIFEAQEGARAGGDVRQLLLGNPTIAGGTFEGAFSGPERRFWQTFTISAFDVPNLRGLFVRRELPDGRPVIDGDPHGRDLMTLTEAELQENVRPYLIDRAYVAEKLEVWGKFDNPMWYARVLGQFPPQSSDALIPLAWAERAANHEWEADPHEKIVVSIDVAGPGSNATVVGQRRGRVVQKVTRYHEADARGTVSKDLEPIREEIATVCVDEVGIGYHFATHLSRRFPVWGINVGKPANDPERFVNRKAELAWAMRLRFEADDIQIPRDDVLIGQLTSVRFGYDERGRVVIESKKALAKRGIPSPDDFDMLLLSMASTGERSEVSSTSDPRPVAAGLQHEDQEGEVTEDLGFDEDAGGA